MNKIGAYTADVVLLKIYINVPPCVLITTMLNKCVAHCLRVALRHSFTMIEIRVFDQSSELSNRT